MAITFLRTLVPEDEAKCWLFTPCRIQHGCACFKCEVAKQNSNQDRLSPPISTSVWERLEYSSTPELIQKYQESGL